MNGSSFSHQVDTQLQCMMNESSMDYASKFADLAAQLAAGPETPHKPDAMVTQDKQQWQNEGRTVIYIKCIYWEETTM